MLKTLSRFNVCNCKPGITNHTSVKKFINEFRYVNPTLVNRISFDSGLHYRNFYLFPDSCLFNCSSQHLTNGNYEIQFDKPSETNYFWENYRKKLSFKERCISRISAVLSCSPTYAELLTNEHPRLFLDEIDDSIEKIDLLTEYHVSKDFISGALWLLYFSKSDLESRLQEMKLWHLSQSKLPYFLPLLKLPEKSFYTVSKTFIKEVHTMPYGNRVLYLSKLLDCNLKLLVKKLVSHKLLLVREFSLIEASIKAFEEFGVPKSELAHDTWALRYTDTVIRSRLKYVTEKGITNIKPWLVRCSESILHKVVDALETEKSITAPFETREEYLSDKLGLPIDLITRVFRRHTEFTNTNMRKLNDMINVLLAAGYSGINIICNPRIFLYNIDSIQERIIQLKSFGIENASLPLLMKRECEYQEIINRIRYHQRKDKVAVTGV